MKNKKNLLPPGVTVLHHYTLPSVGLVNETLTGVGVFFLSLSPLLFLPKVGRWVGRVGGREVVGVYRFAVSRPLYRRVSRGGLSIRARGSAHHLLPFPFFLSHSPTFLPCVIIPARVLFFCYPPSCLHTKKIYNI